MVLTRWFTVRLVSIGRSLMFAEWPLMAELSHSDLIKNAPIQGYKGRFYRFILRHCLTLTHPNHVGRSPVLAAETPPYDALSGPLERPPPRPA